MLQVSFGCSFSIAQEAKNKDEEHIDHSTLRWHRDHVTAPCLPRTRAIQLLSGRR
jgi:hypothetical protein